MSFFKRLFRSKNDTSKSRTVDPRGSYDQSNQAPYSGDEVLGSSEIRSTEYFDERYTSSDIDLGMMEGTLKMIESYYTDNKIDREIESPLNHPRNLDQIVEDGMGFEMYCKAFKMEDSMIVGILAMAFNDYMISQRGFTLYKDSTPEFPLRSMTLKHGEEGAVLSLYPYEYALKVLRYEATFSNLDAKIDAHLKQIPGINDRIDDFLSGK